MPRFRRLSPDHRRAAVGLVGSEIDRDTDEGGITRARESTADPAAAGAPRRAVPVAAVTAVAAAGLSLLVVPPLPPTPPVAVEGSPPSPPAPPFA